MYDMYAWDQPASSADEHARSDAAPGEAGRAPGGTRLGYPGRGGRPDQASHDGSAAGAVRAGTGVSRAVQAVQIALDRRDNGGDGGSRWRG